jgi:hypothetical protein
MEYLPGPKKSISRKTTLYIYGVSFTKRGSLQWRTKYPVRVTASVGMVANLVYNPIITQKGKNMLAEIAKQLLKTSGRCNGLGIFSASVTPTPNFLKPWAIIISSDTAILNKNIPILKVLQDGKGAAN